MIIEISTLIGSFSLLKLSYLLLGIFAFFLLKKTLDNLFPKEDGNCTCEQLNRNRETRGLILTLIGISILFIPAIISIFWPEIFILLLIDILFVWSLGLVFFAKQMPIGSSE